jgi:proteasome activator subunit 4
MWYSSLSLDLNFPPLICFLFFCNQQSLKRIAKFVNANILPGATSEVGLLCCACVHSYPEEASVYLVKPILETIMSSFEGTPTTGYVGRVVADKASTKVCSDVKCLLQYYLSYSICTTTCI